MHVDRRAPYTTGLPCAARLQAFSKWISAFWQNNNPKGSKWLVVQATQVFKADDVREFVVLRDEGARGGVKLSHKSLEVLHARMQHACDNECG